MRVGELKKALADYPNGYEVLTVQVQVVVRGPEPQEIVAVKPGALDTTVLLLTQKTERRYMVG